MTATVTMSLRPLGLNPLDGLNKVITKIECRFAASDGADGFDDSVFDVVPLGEPNPSDFKPLADCTAADYLTWTKAAKGDGYDAWKAALETRATARLSAPKPFNGDAVSVPAD